MDERVEDVLEHCRQRLALGESTEQCLAAYPAHREQLRELLPLLAPLRTLAPVPDPAYVHAARRPFHERLLAEQRGRGAEDESPAPLRWLRRVAIPLAAVIALGGSGAGLVTASADVLPGSPLFPIQQAKEQVVQHLARTPEQQVAYQIDLATRRLQQLRRAEALQKPPATIDALTATMLQATSRAAVDLHSVPEPQRQRILIQIAPLVAAEDRALSAERNQQAGAASAVLETRRQQLLTVEQRLRAEERASPAATRPAPVRHPVATARPTVAKGQPAAARAVPTEPSKGATAPARFTPVPMPTGTPHPANALATRTARLHQLLGKLVRRTPQPVHTATP